MPAEMRTIIALWRLLDDIDTLDDACKSDDAVFRKRAYEIQRKRFDILSGEEFDLLASAPAPASGGVDAVGVCGISADTESKRVLKLHFKHEVTDADRKTIIDAFNTLNRERRSALSTAATPVSEAEPVAFPADGELLNMEDGERANEFWRWAKAAALPLHMAESGLNRFHEDDRTEWAWQAWCAALAKPASSPAVGDVREAAAELLSHLELYDFNERDPSGELYEFMAALKSALSQSTSAGRVGE